MQRFAYTGRAASTAVSGTLEGADASAVADQLVAHGVTPLTIEPQVEPASTRWKRAIERRLRPGLTPVDLMLFCRQIHTLLRSRVPIMRALLGLHESATHLRLKETLADLRRSLDAGIDLSMAFAQHAEVFDHFFVAMIRVGEMTGRLEEVFLRLSEHLQFEVFMRQQVKSALRYPVFVLVTMVAAIGVINVMVIPAFAKVFSSFGAQLPLATRILLATSHFTVRFGWMILAAVVVTVTVFNKWKNSPNGKLKWDRWVLYFPVAGKIVHKATLARFARGFALAMKSGIPAEQAMSVVAQTAENAWIAQRIDGMRAGVERGESILRAASASGVFTPVVLQMIGVGEETGAVDELMEEVAQLYGEEVQYELKTLAQQIEPIMIIFIGVLVLILALGVFLPMWDLSRVAFKK